MHQRGHGDPFQFIDPVAEYGLPGLVHPHEPAVHVAHAQKVEGHVEEGGQVAGGVLRDKGVVGGAGLALGQLLVRPLAADGDGGQLGGGLDEADVLGCGTADLATIDGEGSQHLAARPPDRLRPAGRQPGGAGQMLEIPPQGVGLDVLDDHPVVAEGGRAAGADLGPDLDVAHRLAVVGGQAGRRGEPEPPPRLVHQIDAAGDGRILGLHRLDDRLQHLADRRADGHQRHGAVERTGRAAHRSQTLTGY